MGTGRHTTLADNLTPEQRRLCMSRVRTRGTALERAVITELRARAIRFSVQAKDLPGRPDIVFRQARLAVFVDGDFWHGYRFPAWAHKLSAFWQGKIASNRLRDRRNFASLRRNGWRVLRLWKHDILANPARAVDRIAALVHASRAP